MYTLHQGIPGIAIEGQKGEPGDPGFSSSPLRSNNNGIRFLFLLLNVFTASIVSIPILFFQAK